MALRRAILGAIREPIGIRGYASIAVSVMRDGVRYSLRGEVGDTLAVAMAKDDALVSAVPVMSIDRGHDAHVVIPDEFLAKMPEMGPLDVDKLEDVAVEAGPNSRLASQVTLTQELDGLVAALGESWPENTM